MSTGPALTVGMACYDDFEGVWFTVNALRLYHADAMPEVEIVVVDNHPDSADGAYVRNFVENWVPGARYVPFREATGTAAPRNEVFAQARGAAVLCLDSHVLLEPDALRRLIEFYEANPDCNDLLQGPLVYDDLKSYSSHFEDEWRAEMWGIWGTDPRAEFHRDVRREIDPATGERTSITSTAEQPPFEIPAQGLGLFSCRKSAWLGFHPQFRGFGGEEFYIHEKFRQAGRRALCLPFLRWIHRFNRPRGIPYPLTVDHKFRNYVLGLTELGLPLEPAIEHFSAILPADVIARILADPLREPQARPTMVTYHTPTPWHVWWSSMRKSLARRFHRNGAPPGSGTRESFAAPQPREVLANSAKPAEILTNSATEGKPALRQPLPCGHDEYLSAGREPAQMGWYEWIARRHLGARFIDVGAGTGAGMAYLQYLGAAEVRGFEIDERLRHLPGMTIGRSPLEAFGPASCDVAVSLDAIEHVVEDIPFVRELRKLATQAVYITTPNFSRSQARNTYHAREYTIGEFVKAFLPDELWVASPDGWYHRTWLLERQGDRYRHRLSGESWSLEDFPEQHAFNQGSPDGLEWAHFCGVFLRGPDTNPTR